MLASQRLAIAAHLHVLLRRKTGRVTDTEWMAANLEYAMEIVRFCRAKALEDGHTDLAEWAAKLEQAVTSQKPPARPLAQTAMQLLREGAAAAPLPAPVAVPEAVPSEFTHSVTGESGFSESLFEGERRARPRDPNAPRYVGGIR